MRKFFALCLLLATTACGADLVDKSLQIEALEAVNAGAVLVDVRRPDEVAEGTLNDAVNIPHDAIVPGINALNIDKQQTVVVFCRSGNRAGKAKAALEAAGFSHVVNAGGYDDLKAVREALEQR